MLTGLLLTGCGGSGARSPAPSPQTAPPAGGIPRSLLAGERTIGRGPRFDPPARGPAGIPCAPRLGPRVAAHVEVFAANHVVLIGTGVGTRPPRTESDGRIVRAACFGPVITLDPTGVVLVRPGSPPPLSALFRAWGERLSRTELASFHASPGQAVAAFVDGRPWHGSVTHLPLRNHSEIVLEVGPHVPPHRAYTFPPLPPASTA